MGNCGDSGARTLDTISFSNRDAYGDSGAKTLDTSSCSKNYMRMIQGFVTCGAVLTRTFLRTTLACAVCARKTVASRPSISWVLQATSRCAKCTLVAVRPCLQSSKYCRNKKYHFHRRRSIAKSWEVSCHCILCTHIIRTGEWSTLPMYWQQRRPPMLVAPQDF